MNKDNAKDIAGWIVAVVISAYLAFWSGRWAWASFTESPNDARRADLDVLTARWEEIREYKRNADERRRKAARAISEIIGK